MIKYLIIGINKNSKKKILFKVIDKTLYNLFKNLTPKAVRKLSICIPFISLNK